MAEDDNSCLYDIVAVRPGENGSSEIRRLLAGPYDEIDARYQAKRLRAVSPGQTYIVVAHHVCRQCAYLALTAPIETARLTVAEINREWDKAHTALMAAKEANDSVALQQADDKITQLAAEGEERAAAIEKVKEQAEEMVKDGPLSHTCSTYYSHAVAI